MINRLNVTKLLEQSDAGFKCYTGIYKVTFDKLIEASKDCTSTWLAIQAIAPKIGCTLKTLRSWYKKHIDQTIPASVQAQSFEVRIKYKELERENRELKQANEIIRKAAAFFAQAEMDRPPK